MTRQHKSPKTATRAQATKRKHAARRQKYSKLFGGLNSAASGLKSFPGIFSKKRGNNTTRGESSREGKHVDRVLLFLTIGLLIFGWIMIYSGSFFIASQRANTLFTPYNPFHFFILHGIWITIGSIACYIICKIHYLHLKKLIIPALFVVIGLLLLVIILPHEINGAKSWIIIGGFTLQPSELAKPVLVVYLASLFAKQDNNAKFDMKTYLTKQVAPFAIATLGISGLVIIGGDLGSAAILLGTALIMFFISDRRWQHDASVGVFAGLGALAGTIFIAMEPYRLTRVKNYLEFLVDGQFRDQLNTGYQLYQTILAVGSGGLFGYGFGQSRQKYNYLQETAFNDTIFAVVAEEFGLLGSILLIVAFATLFFRGLKIAQHSPDRFSAFIAIGIVAWLFVQTLVHLGVNVGLIPLTGLTLPFISAGGSSLLACMAGIGLLLNVSKEANLQK